MGGVGAAGRRRVDQENVQILLARGVTPGDFDRDNVVLVRAFVRGGNIGVEREIVTRAASQVTGPEALSVAFVAIVNGPPVYVTEVLASEIVPLAGVVAKLTSAISAPTEQSENAAITRRLKIPASEIVAVIHRGEIVLRPLTSDFCWLNREWARQRVCLENSFLHSM